MSMKAERLYNVKFDWFEEEPSDKNYVNPLAKKILRHEEFVCLNKSPKVIRKVLSDIYPNICNMEITVNKDTAPKFF